jgi:hypothetical protein
MNESSAGNSTVFLLALDLFMLYVLAVLSQGFGFNEFDTEYNNIVAYYLKI